MKKIRIFLLVWLLLGILSTILTVSGCTKTGGNATGRSHLYVVTDCRSEFSTEYTSSVQLIKGFTLVTQGSNQGVGKDTVDLGVVPTGTYKISSSSYRVSGGSAILPNYAYSGDVSVTELIQYVVVMPR